MGVKSDILTLETISIKLTESILQETVNKIQKSDTEIKSYQINYASSKGDSYLGVVYRVEITLVNNCKMALIAKGMPKNLARRKLFHCKEFFATEHLFYSKIVPEMIKFEGTDAKTSLLQIPECYVTFCDGENDFLLLQDLKQLHYENTDRSLGLNSAQITTMLQMFARFHGISLAMKILTPEIFKEITTNIIEPLYSEQLESWYSKNAIKIANIFYESIKSEISGTKYEKKLLDFINPEKLYLNLVKNVSVQEPAVICHGDIWLTNFMFNGKGCKAIDFQMLRYGSPMLDISTFIFCCITKEQRMEYGGLGKILDVYREELNITVTSLGVPMTSPGTTMTFASSPVTSQGITQDQMNTMWKQVGAHGFGAALALVPISVIDNDSVGDLDLIDIDTLCEQGLGLEDVITQFGPITSRHGKQRLIDTVVFAVEENLI